MSNELISRSQRNVGSDVEKAKDIWKNVDALILDVDSTLIQELALHELAKFCGKSDQVLQLANEAMAQQIPFEEALKTSVALIRPSSIQIAEFNTTRALNLSPKVRELIQLLQSKEVPVYLASGSFRCLIEPLSKDLKIPEENVFCNRFKFFYDGQFAGYKEDEPTTESTGKAVLAEMLKEKFGYKNLVNIGDGYTDMEACPPSDCFIGYGGNVTREFVKNGAMWFVTDFAELIQTYKKK